MKTLTFCLAMILSSTIAFGQQYKVLWNFTGPQQGEDGSFPLGNLIMDGARNLYGTTKTGGAQNAGTVFELSPNSDGSWEEVIIYSFCSQAHGPQCLDGDEPAAGLVLDKAGNLYGTTSDGGDTQCVGCYSGTVFELSPPSSGNAWIESVLYNFCSAYNGLQCLDGAFPVSQLVFDASGNIYGTTEYDGAGRGTGGTVFELSLKGTGGWTEQVLYNFCTRGSGKSCPDGSNPMAGVTFNASGNLLGTTETGGGNQNQRNAFGTIYELTPGANGWIESVRIAFTAPKVGGFPLGAVSLSSGNIYSTFSRGGTNQGGGVFKLDKQGKLITVPLGGVNNNITPTSGVLLDAKRGVLYGTASGGGNGTAGGVFQVTAQGALKTLYTFCSQTNCADGENPVAGLIEDAAGNLYGTTENGGANGFGVVFEITP